MNGASSVGMGEKVHRKNSRPARHPWNFVESRSGIKRGPRGDESGTASIADRSTIVRDYGDTATLDVHIDVHKYKTRTRKRTP